MTDEGDRQRDADDRPMGAYDRTVDQLATGLVPVRRVWSLRGRAALWAILAAALIAGSTMLAPRPDLAAHLGRSAAWAELGLLLAILVGCGVVALRGAVPGSGSAGRGIMWAGLGAVLVAGLGLFGPVDQSMSLEQFLVRGIPCAGMTLGLGGAAALVLIIMVGRGFPLAPAATGASAGIAGAATAVLAMRLHCPLDEMSHQLAFHASTLLPVALTGALLTWAWRRVSD